MTSEFERASTVEEIEKGRFRAIVPEGWQQGRGAFGGLALALLLRAIEQSEQDRTRTTRVLTGDLSGPLMPGEAELVVVELRRGKLQTNWRAELRQRGELAALATVVMSAPRPAGDLVISPPPAPEAPDWARVAPVPIGPPTGPVFAQHYEYRSTGPAPFSGGEARAEGWIREKLAPKRLDAPALVALLDAWWPASLAVDRTMRPVATVSFTAEILCDPATLPPDERLFHKGRAVVEREGFVVELRELWSHGSLVALNQQTFALLG